MSHYKALYKSTDTLLYFKDVLPNINRTQTTEKCRFLPGDLDIWPLTLTFNLGQARDQTRLPCEFGANPFSGSQGISYTKKPQTDGAKNRAFCTSPCVVNMMVMVR